MDITIEEYDHLLILAPDGCNSDNADSQNDRKVHELPFVMIILLEEANRRERTGLEA